MAWHAPWHGSALSDEQQRSRRVSRGMDDEAGAFSSIASSLPPRIFLAESAVRAALPSLHAVIEGIIFCAGSITSRMADIVGAPRRFLRVSRCGFGIKIAFFLQ